MKQEIVDILKCPISSNDLKIVSIEGIKRLNTLINSKKLFFANAKTVTDELEVALVTKDDAFYYPVIDNIIMLRNDKALSENFRQEHRVFGRKH